MAAGVLAMQGAKAPAGMVLTVKEMDLYSVQCIEM